MTDINNVISNMIPVDVDGDDGFRKVKETLTRMGVPAKNENKLFQSVHILHKQGQYYLCHFKEMFALDGRESTLSDGDVARRNRIALMLEEWGLVTITDQERTYPIGKPSMVKVIKYSEANEWQLQPKYAIGVKKKRG
ncbi:MAG: translational repressor RegA [Nitrosopumilaceae archaeon]|nr:translational repressor RegA [Nitrosopumilaceae archaeon]